MSERADRIKEASNILEFISKDMALKSQAGGKRYLGLCPFHKDEKNPNFNVFPDDGRFYCFSCKAAGTIIDYVMMRDKVEIGKALDKLGEHYGIPKTERKGSQGPTSNRDSARAIAQAYLANALRTNPDLAPLRDWLKARNVDEKDWDRWKLGGGTGTMKKDLSDKITEDAMIGIGILGQKEEKGIRRTWDWIKAGWLTVPIHRDDNRLSHWHLRDPHDKNAYQMYKKHRNGGLFHNPRALHEDEVFLVEGFFEVCQLEKLGRRAAAVLGAVSNEQIDVLKALRQPGHVFPEKERKKTFNIWMDRDNNESGQNQALRLAAALWQFHNVFICKGPEGKDPDDFIREGGDVETIERHPYTKGRYDVEPTYHGYIIHRNGKADGATYQDLVTNFTLDIKYNFLDEKENISRLVLLRRANDLSKPLLLRGDDIYNRNQFQKWLSLKSKHCVLKGKMDDYESVLEYLKETDPSQTIAFTPYYGAIDSRTWVFDNGAIRDGEVVMADNDGIIPVEYGGYPALRTAVGTELKDLDVKSQLIPEKWDSLEYNIQVATDFYPENMSKPMIGWAIASILRDVWWNYFEWFPHAFFLGRPTRGKSKGARMVQSWIGATNVPTDTARSTKPAFMKHAMQFKNMPVTFTEYDPVMEGILIDWYDGNLYSKSKDQGLATVTPTVNASLMVTSMHTPTSEALLSRCVVLDFNTFTYRRKQKTEYDQAWNRAVKTGGGFGFLVGILNSNLREIVIDKVQDMVVELNKISRISRSNDRLIMTYASVYGSLWALCETKQYGAFVRSIYKGISLESLAADAAKAIETAEMTMKGQDHLSVFFGYMRTLYVQKELDHCVQLNPPTGPATSVRFHLGDAYNAIMNLDIRTRKVLHGVNKEDIANQLLGRFDLIPKTGRIHGAPIRTYSIDLSTLMEEFEIDFYSIDESDEAQDGTSSDSIEPVTEDLDPGAASFDPSIFSRDDESDYKGNI